jgi:hypothetical protein
MQMQQADNFNMFYVHDIKCFFLLAYNDAFIEKERDIIIENKRRNTGMR